LSPADRFDFDIAVAGGGPAGAATAIELARRGRRVVLLERDRFPRFHIGESLVATAGPCFDRLGVTDAVRAAGFPAKWGASLSTHDGGGVRAVEFASSDEVAQPQTWQVERARLDRILLDRARDAGAEVREGCRVAACELAGDGVTLRLASESAGPSTVRVRAVVDATGRSGLLANQLRLRRDEPGLANVSIYAHFSGVEPLPSPKSGDIRIVARADAGWFWLIPIDERLTSVGVVLPRALYLSLERGDPGRMLAALVADTPVVAAWLAGARREWPVRVEKDFSYSVSAYAGDRWLLVGDAGSFLDPVFSTGVAIALESGLEAATALDAALAKGEPRLAGFRAFERTQRQRYARFRRFVVAFYTPWFRDLFFQPAAPSALFRAVVTVLAGIWKPRLRTRLLLEVFFAAAALQRYFRLAPRLVLRGPGLGYPSRSRAAARRPA